VSEYPRIFLAIDNCFASKRWTRPVEWAREITDLGVRYVETSADTELDPLYHGTDYIRGWLDEVRDAAQRYGISVANLYSGHGTYATLGLAHTDEEIRTRFLDSWLKPMIDTAGSLGAGLGFFCHAFPQSVLADADAYAESYATLVENLADVARYARERYPGIAIGVEQMYSPHQVPWTIVQAHELISRVWSASDRAPFYLTLDVGHQSGQHRYQRPTRVTIERARAAAHRDGGTRDLWVGPDSVSRLVADAAPVETILGEMERYPYMFAEPRDGDPYAWLEELAGWSPIVHLQQTDGRSSAHRPFTDQTNAEGIIDAQQVLAAIARHYERAASTEEAGDKPPRVKNIYLTIEVFSGTAEYPSEIRDKLARSVEYWRRYVPTDGTPLDQLVHHNGGHA
jgi:sugar phosphate isomerase/epimerase